MASVRGKAGVQRYFAQLPNEIRTKLLRGAGRAGANVIAKEARERSISPEVSAAVKVKVEAVSDKVVARIQVNMGRYNLPLWLEFGTASHFISVADGQRGGMSVGRINKRVGDGSLVIGGSYVGDTVFHPGARPHPFLRPALDVKATQAVGAAQRYINARVSPAGITGTAEG